MSTTGWGEKRVNNTSNESLVNALLPPAEHTLMTREEARQELIARLLQADNWIDEHGMPGHFTSTGWIPPEGKLPFYVYWAAIIRITEWAKMIHWCLGDMLNYGERVYGETYAQVADVTGHSKNTLYRDTWVCRAIPREIRRHPDEVAFTTHMQLAPHRYSVEVKAQWLEKCVSQGWKGGQLKEELRKDGRSAQVSSTDGEVPTSKSSSSIHEDRSDAQAEQPQAQEEKTEAVSGVYCPHCGAFFVLEREVNKNE